jgi:hypothetical protein
MSSPTIRQYIWTVFVVSFGSWDKGEKVTNLIIYVTAFLIGLGVSFGILPEVWTNWDPARPFGAALVIGLVVLLVFITPARLWVENQKVINRYEEAASPRVSISDPKEFFLPWFDHSMGQDVVHHFYITITNDYAGRLTNCSVREESFVNVIGHEAPERGRYFRLRRERKADKEAHEFERTFDLRGKGSSEDIEICSFDERSADSQVVMYYATKPSDRQKDWIGQAVFPHTLVVAVSTDEVPNQVCKTFKILIENGKLLMKTVSDGPIGSAL